MKPEKRLFVSACLFFCGSVAAPGEPAAIISKEEVRSAIIIFRQDPLSPRGRAAGEIVRSFAEKDDSVFTNVSEKVAPFLSNVQLSKEDRALLLDAYIVGAVDSQLLKKERKDDPYSGVTEVIHVYQQVQHAHPAVSLPEIEKFIEMEKRGELKKYVETP